MYNLKISIEKITADQVQQVIDALAFLPLVKHTIKPTKNNRAEPLYLDLKLMKNALEGLLNEGKEYTINDLIKLALERNIVITETE